VGVVGGGKRGGGGGGVGGFCGGGGGGQPSNVWTTFASVIAVVRVCGREEGRAGMCVCLCTCVCGCVFLNQRVEGR